MIEQILKYINKGQPVDIERMQDIGQELYGILYPKKQIETLIKYVKG